jgi:hypothetical protein
MSKKITGAEAPVQTVDKVRGIAPDFSLLKG